MTSVMVPVAIEELQPGLQVQAYTRDGKTFEMP